MTPHDDPPAAPSPPPPPATAAAASAQPRNPLHGLTLEAIVNALVAHHGWAALGARVPIRCFTHDPSVSSSLKFLRRTPWAREKVEQLYLDMVGAAEPPRAARPQREGRPERVTEPPRAEEAAPAARSSGLSGLRPVRRP